VSWNVDRLRYFTKKGEAVIDAVKPVVASDGRVVQLRHKLPGGQAEVRLISKYDADKKSGGEGVRVEILKAGQQKAEVLLAEAQVCVPTVSPNGRMLALWCLTGTGKKDQERIDIFIVNDKGTVTAKVDVPR
jgi:hypothetical protein